MVPPVELCLLPSPKSHCTPVLLTNGGGGTVAVNDVDPPAGVNWLLLVTKIEPDPRYKMKKVASPAMMRIATTTSTMRTFRPPGFAAAGGISGLDGSEGAGWT